eukprot:PLAT15056.1.p2 GENE.PLAT15056.1~~PLAT15056.1.p2  ORF type:complete len:344 (-),score=122.07 PLAT15056.1:509-1513(-)
MKSTLLLLLACAGCALVAAQNDAQAPIGGVCNPSYTCGFKYVDQNENIWHYDLSSLCSPKDFTSTDGQKHTYHSRVCGVAQYQCLPSSWKNTLVTGVSVQTWGAKPKCPPKACTVENQPACCSEDCQVIGHNAPLWEPVDPGNPATGGIQAHYHGVPPTADDPFWCSYDPETKAPYDRRVSFIFNCNTEVSGLVIKPALQNQTVDCHYRLFFDTPFACGNYGVGLSGGWVFVIILFVLASVYLLVGSVYQYHKEGIWALPNRLEWAAFGALVKDGVDFTLSSLGAATGRAGGSSGAAPAADGAYSSIDEKSSGSYHAGGGELSAGASSDPYSDL